MIRPACLKPDAKPIDRVRLQEIIDHADRHVLGLEKSNTMRARAEAEIAEKLGVLATIALRQEQKGIQWKQER